MFKCISKLMVSTTVADPQDVLVNCSDAKGQMLAMACPWVVAPHPVAYYCCGCIWLLQCALNPFCCYHFHRQPAARLAVKLRVALTLPLLLLGTKPCIRQHRTSISKCTIALQPAIAHLACPWQYRKECVDAIAIELASSIQRNEWLLISVENWKVVGSTLQPKSPSEAPGATATQANIG